MSFTNTSPCLCLPQLDASGLLSRARVSAALAQQTYFVPSVAAALAAAVDACPEPRGFMVGGG